MDWIKPLIEFLHASGDITSIAVFVAVIAVLALAISARLNLRFIRRETISERAIRDAERHENKEAHGSHTAAIKSLQTADVALCAAIKELKYDINRDYPPRAEVNDITNRIVKTLDDISGTMREMQIQLGEKVDLKTCISMQNHTVHGP
jgi:hypothetical protein